MSFSHSVRVSLRSLLILASLVLLMGAVPAEVSEKDALGALEATQAGFRLIHDKLAPSLVLISSQMEMPDNNTDMLDRFFGNPNAGPRIQNASGSGVLIGKEGIILTNSHVVANATKVTVQLAGSDRKLPAVVVQSDPRTDLAIVRITEKGTYPTAVLGDANTVHVGDWAIAFGSPFRLSSTMTVGVISAIGRRLNGPVGDFTYRDLLQTDASINPGNSGGPLVNVRGEVIGINFMIFSPGDTAGSVGIGFAIPINEYTREIINTLTTGKSFERGMMGVVIKELDDALRDQTGVKEGGVFVDSVVAGAAAEKAGIKAEDVITNFNGQKVNGADQFVNIVERTHPGAKVVITVMRDGKEVQITATVGAAPTGAKSATANRQYGFTVVAVTPELVSRYHLLSNSGVLVTELTPGSAGDDAGLEQGDIIQRVTGVPVTTAEEFWTAVEHGMATSRHGVLLRIRRGDTATTLTLQSVEPKTP